MTDPFWFLKILRIATGGKLVQEGWRTTNKSRKTTETNVITINCQGGYYVAHQLSHIKQPVCHDSQVRLIRLAEIVRWISSAQSAPSCVQSFDLENRRPQLWLMSAWGISRPQWASPNTLSKSRPSVSFGRISCLPCTYSYNLSIQHPKKICVYSPSFARKVPCYIQ